MAKIRVRYLLHLYTLVGKREDLVEIPHEDPTVRHVIENLAEMYGGPFRRTLIDTKRNELRVHASLDDREKAHRFLLNGINIMLLKGDKTKVKEGDIVSIY
ncbi:MAG: MoaD/ThiS family protein [Candidatus Ranarchaeia archaeon]|jgi:molybdopterin converting factor small subunit